MKPFAVLLLACFSFSVFHLRSHAQQAIPSISFSSVGPILSVQMTGTATWTYGSDQQTGTVSLQANANGQSRMVLQLAAGPRVETQNPFSDPQRKCTWSTITPVARPTAVHQCWLDTIWFLPQITMQAGAGAVDDVASVLSTQDASVIRLHHERRLTNADSPETAQLIARLSAVDLDTDAATGRPTLLTYAAHPDNDAGVDLPVEVRYSGYSSFNGVTVPTHIQKFINHSLVLDLQISGVQLQLSASATLRSSSATLQ